MNKEQQLKHGIKEADDSKRTSRKISFRIRDISLQRLYSILYVYFDLFDDYNFDIVHKSKYYELRFNAWVGRAREGRET